MFEIEMYESIIEGLSDPVTVIDREYNLVYYNKTKGDVFGFVQEEVVGKKCYKVTFNIDEPCEKCSARAVLVTGEPCALEIYVELPDGRNGWVEQRGFPIYAGGKLAHIIVMGHDITEKVEKNKKSKHYINELERNVADNIALNPRGKPKYSDKPIADLSPREIEVLRLMAEGFANPEISQILSISKHTVKSHTTHIFNKVGVNDRTQASVWAARNGIV